MTELKKCPFCGGEVKISTEQVDAVTEVYNFVCSSCDSYTYFDFCDREEAIEAWNRRTTTKEDMWDIVIANNEKSNLNNLPTTTEAEIREKIITAMSKAMKEFYPSCKGAYRDFDVFFHAVMAKVAEQMEEGADND